MAFWWLSPFASAPVRTPDLNDVRALLQHPAALLMSRAVVLTVAIVATIGLYRRRRIAALLFATATATGWGLCEQTILLRYPGGAYFIDLPFLGPAFLLRDVELAGRTANVAAPVLWLFALRPWLIGRWPDLRILPVGLLLFWQKDVIYYFDTAYLEPWAVVFSMLAVELLVARGSSGAALACLLIGAAATVKEPFIVALPFVWLAGAPWRQSMKDALNLTGAAFAAGTSFVLYFVAHKNLEATNLETGRGLRFGFPFAQLDFYAQEFMHRVAATFTGTTAVAAIIALILLPAMVWLLPSRRLELSLASTSGLALLLLFVVEQDSLGWIGSFRFLLPSFPFFCVGALAFGYAAVRRTALAAVAVCLLLLGPSALSGIASAAGPASRLNFIEAYDAPIFLPMKALLTEARAKGWLRPDVTVLANAPDTSLRVLPGIPVSYGPPGELYCECRDDRPAVMGLFVRYANLNVRSAQEPPSGASFSPPVDRDQLWRASRAARPLCLVKLRQSCGHVLQRVEDDELVAVLGLR